jgi:hypothetical protein
MPLFWDAFEKGVEIELRDIRKGKTYNSVAKKISTLYHTAVKLGRPKQVPTFSPFVSKVIGLQSRVIHKGFETTFSSGLKLQKELTPTDWMPAATSIVAYWTGKNLIGDVGHTTPWIGVGPGAPPPPPATTLPIGILPVITHNILIPGSPTPLNKQLSDAWKLKKPELVAAAFRKACENHVKIISGTLIYTILPPGIPPAPAPPLVWIGLE